jgi:hypothetical protein
MASKDGRHCTIEARGNQALPGTLQYGSAVKVTGCVLLLAEDRVQSLIAFRRTKLGI